MSQDPTVIRTGNSRTAVAFAAILWLVAAACVGLAGWVAFVHKPDAPQSTFYILQWTNTSKCTMATALPDWGQFRIVWQTHDRDTAMTRLDQYEKSFRCM